jgi:hypothetical protein
VRGTASDPEILAAIDRAERANVRFAQLWREVMAPDRDLNARGPEVEALRRTAKAALLDWLEARG